MIQACKLAILVMIFVAAFGSLSSARAFNLFQTACNDSVSQASPACQQAASEGGKNNRVTGTKSVINTAVNIIALITGIAAVIMIIVGGFTMVTSAGNPESVTAARRRVIAAVIGLVIVALSWTIVSYIVNNVPK